MSVISSYRIDVSLPSAEGVTLFSMASVGGRSDYSSLSVVSHESPTAARAALAGWLAAVALAVARELHSEFEVADVSESGIDLELP